MGQLVKSLILCLVLSGCAVFETTQPEIQPPVKIAQIQKPQEQPPHKKTELCWIIMWVVISILCGFFIGGSKADGWKCAVFLRSLLRKK